MLITPTKKCPPLTNKDWEKLVEKRNNRRGISLLVSKPEKKP